MGNNNHISLSNLDGMHFLWLNAYQFEWLSVCCPRPLCFQFLRWQLRWAEVGGYGTACMALRGLFSWARRAAQWASRAARERSGVSDWISMCVLWRSSLECAVSQGRSGAGWQASSLQGLFWRNTPLSTDFKFLGRESHSATSSAECIYLVEQVQRS